MGRGRGRRKGKEERERKGEGRERGRGREKGKGRGGRGRGWEYMCVYHFLQLNGCFVREKNSSLHSRSPTTFVITQLFLGVHGKLGPGPCR